MYFSKKINYKEPFKNFTFLLLIFFFINNLIALKAGENISFGNSEKINTKLESIFNQNTIKYSQYDNIDSQFNIFFGYPSENTGRTLYPDLSIIYYSEDIREQYKMKLLDMTKNKNIYKIYR